MGGRLSLHMNLLRLEILMLFELFQTWWRFVGFTCRHLYSNREFSIYFKRAIIHSLMKFINGNTEFINCMHAILSLCNCILNGTLYGKSTLRKIHESWIHEFRNRHPVDSTQLIRTTNSMNIIEFSAWLSDSTFFMLPLEIY